MENDWKIETVDRYWHWNGRNSMRFVEVTFWYCAKTLERKETTRTESIYTGQEHKLPEWAKSISIHRKSLDYDS